MCKKDTVNAGLIRLALAVKGILLNEKSLFLVSILQMEVLVQVVKCIVPSNGNLRIMSTKVTFSALIKYKRNAASLHLLFIITYISSIQTLSVPVSVFCSTLRNV